MQTHQSFFFGTTTVADDRKRKRDDGKHIFKRLAHIHAM